MAGHHLGAGRRRLRAFRLVGGTGACERSRGGRPCVSDCGPAGDGASRPDHRIVPGPNRRFPRAARRTGPQGPCGGRRLRRGRLDRRRHRRSARREPCGNRRRDRLQRRRDGGRDGRQERAPEARRGRRPGRLQARRDGVRKAPERAATVGSAPKRLVAAADTVAKLGSIASALTLAPARRDGATGEPTRFGGIVTPTGAPLPATAIGHLVRHAASNGWRHATATREAPTQPLERVSGQLAGFAAPVTQPGSPSSGGTGLAGTAALALFALLALLIFGSQRPGALAWLRPASAPASPFLALPERPG